MPNSRPGALGSVVSLWRYPVKSMMGEELNASEVTERGLLGDRGFAVVDRETGKVASAKNPLKWGRLFDCRAAFVEAPRREEKLPPVRITLPDGTDVTSDSPEVHKKLSAVFGREVALESSAPRTPSLEEYWPDIDGLAHRETVTDEAMSAGTFFDFAVVHLLTTATLDRLRELYAQGRFEARRFRPNITVEMRSTEKGFPESAWMGRTVAVGEFVRLNVIIPCPRCVMTTLPQGDLPKDPGILRTAAQHTQRIEVQGQTLAALVGVYTGVARGGTIRRGESVWLEEAAAQTGG